MPTSGGYQYFWEVDPRRWERCRAEAGQQMIAEGWNPHAGKFDQVRRKRAMKLWNKK